MREKLQPLGLLVLRASFGLLLAFRHGLPKLLGFSEKAAHFADPLHVGHTASLSLAIFGELFCALGVALGLFTRLAAIPPIATMVVAFFVVEAGAPFADRELAFVYLIPFVTVLLVGPGPWSIDGLLARRRAGKKAWK